MHPLWKQNESVLLLHRIRNAHGLHTHCKQSMCETGVRKEGCTSFNDDCIGGCLRFNACIVGVARYTDVTVRYVPRFGGHGSIRFRYNMKKRNLCSVSFHLFWTDSSANKKKIHLDVKILHIITCYIYKIVLYSLWVYTNKSRPLYSDY